MKSSTKLSLKFLFGSLFTIIFITQFFTVITTPVKLFPQVPIPPATQDGNLNENRAWFDKFVDDLKQGDYIKDYQNYELAVAQAQADQSNESYKAIQLGTELSIYLILGLVLLRSATRQLKKERDILKTNRKTIMNYFKEHQKMVGISIIIILFFGFCFYWYQYRPMSIKQDCYNSIFGPSGQRKYDFSDTVHKDRYQGCLASKGL